MRQTRREREREIMNQVIGNYRARRYRCVDSKTYGQNEKTIDRMSDGCSALFRGPHSTFRRCPPKQNILSIDRNDLPRSITRSKPLIWIFSFVSNHPFCACGYLQATKNVIFIRICIILIRSLFTCCEQERRSSLQIEITLVVTGRKSSI